MPSTTEMETETDVIARGMLAKGRGWKARELIVELRELTAEEKAAGADTRIPVRLSSEAPVLRYDWWNDEVYTEILDHSQVDLSYARDGLPFCLDHWTMKQIGLVEDVKVVGKELHGMVQFGHHPDAEWVEKDIRAGIRKKVSLGYIQGEYTSEKRKGSEAEERRYAFMPLEGSSVCIPADYEVGFGRSHLRALRSEQVNSPISAQKAKETPMADNGIEAPDAGAEAREAEKLRVNSLRDLIDSIGADAGDVVDAIAAGTGAREFMRKHQEKVEARNAEATRGVTTAAPHAFVRSSKGPIGRDGNVKTGEEGGFDSPGEFFRAAIIADARGNVDPRLLRAAPTGQSEQVGSEGGWTVPVQYLNEIIKPMYDTGAMLSRVRRIPMSGNSLKYQVVDETSRANGARFGAVTSEWAGEVQAPANAGKVKLREHMLDLKKIIAKAALTNDLIEDSPAMSAMLPEAFTQELNFRAEDAIVRGTGNGQPLGFMRANGPLATVAIEATQTLANTGQFIATNLAKMLATVPSANWGRCVFLYNQELLPYFVTATIGGTGGTPVWLPSNGLAGTPFNTLLGVPAVAIEYAEAPGTLGDLFLCDLSQYMWGEKSSGPKVSSSAHVRFLEDEEVLKFTWRVDGHPTWKQAITPYKGSTRSPFVTLAAR